MNNTGETNNSISRNYAKNRAELRLRLAREHTLNREKQLKHRQLFFKRLNGIYIWIDKLTDEK